MSGACLGDAVAGLVDGELDHSARERAQRHLLHCADCRAEVEAHRRLKAQLAGLGRNAPAPAALTEQLLALAVPGTDRVPGTTRPAARPVTLRASAHPRGRRSDGHRSDGGRPAHRRRTAVGSALVALGVVALALGGPQSAATTPVDPGADSFVVRHVGTTGDAPRVARASINGEGTGSRR